MSNELKGEKKFTKQIKDLLEEALRNDDELKKCNYRISCDTDEDKKKETVEALKTVTPKVRYEVGKRIRLRKTPELNFILDESLERGFRITKLIDQISRGEI